MSPSRIHNEDEDPVTAEYDVYLTPSQQQQLLLLQYPNRAADRPYTQPSPDQVRLKPKSGHIELEIPLRSNGNFNKYQSLKWGSNLPSQDNGTYGLAGGLTSHFMTNGRRRGSTDEVDRDNQVSNDLATFSTAEHDGKTLATQTLGGQIIRHDGSGDESGKPLYFIGAFKGQELHLSQIAGTVQMRPVFHHLDAEDTRDRLANRDAAPAPERAEARPRIVHQSYKSGPPGGSGNPKGELEEQSANLTRALRDAAEEKWVRCTYVDDGEDLAFDVYGQRLFNADAGGERCKVLKAGIDGEEWLDAMTAPAMRGAVRRRRGGKKAGEDDGEELG